MSGFLLLGCFEAGGVCIADRLFAKKKRPMRFASGVSFFSLTLEQAVVDFFNQAPVEKTFKISLR